MSKNMRLAVLSAAACVFLMGCTPVIDQRGYLPDPDLESKIAAGTDTKTSIQQRLGYPSTQATFGNTGPGNDAWYYISSIEKQVAFFNPTIQSRSILAVYFDKDGKVTDLKHYSLKDGHVVAFETRTTPAKGRELTFLQQLFNASPGVPLGQTGQDQNPGGGQGPPGPGH
jgi:outer membrane protein assembly factor BamE (lipoprotein component of BamABCDE complex)